MKVNHTETEKIPWGKTFRIARCTIDMGCDVPVEHAVVP